jgi:hypothetical protein
MKKMKYTFWLVEIVTFIVIVVIGWTAKATISNRIWTDQKGNTIYMQEVWDFSRNSQ